MLEHDGPMGQEALQRLRAERDAEAVLQEEEAIVAGQVWAHKEASYAQLKAVAKLDDQGYVDEPDAFGCADVLDAIEGKGEWFPADAERFAEEWFGKSEPSAEEVRGFVRGAAEVFEQV